ncbi:hypothetical protein OSB04_020314 [Centaurea solstitialis]|uniref:Uncharacterized protein n=1 Tax=Centaurea solstitialis TaxID=347529 RepID=A0AA38T5E2_9ASTR|nr:hypothetical protein OSB04_020314 [Centaurea solstitialis]
MYVGENRGKLPRMKDDNHRKNSNTKKFIPPVITKVDRHYDPWSLKEMWDIVEEGITVTTGTSTDA